MSTAILTPKSSFKAVETKQIIEHGFLHDAEYSPVTASILSHFD
jgi:hypothetical protein